MSLRSVAHRGAGLLLMAGLLSACSNPVSWVTGKSAVDEYCGELESHRVAFADMFAEGTAQALLKNLPMLEEIGAKAPSDITDDWQNLLTPIQGLEKALAQAGLSATSFHNGVPPAGTSAADRQRIASAAALLAAPASTNASGAIDQQARDVCKLNLGM